MATAISVSISYRGNLRAFIGRLLSSGLFIEVGPSFLIPDGLPQFLLKRYENRTILPRPVPKRILLSVDPSSQHRISELRREIALLQHDNELYRLKQRRAPSEVSSNELRRLRLLAIREELLRLHTYPKRIQ